MTQPAGTCEFTWRYHLNTVLVYEWDFELELEVDHDLTDGWTHRVVGVSIVTHRYDNGLRRMVETGRVVLTGLADPFAIFVSCCVKRAAEDVTTFDGQVVFERAMENVGNPHMRHQARWVA